jgi:HAD superfamily hydrolase (TIGR01509 family)
MANMKFSVLDVAPVPPSKPKVVLADLYATLARGRDREPIRTFAREVLGLEETGAHGWVSPAHEQFRAGMRHGLVASGPFSRPALPFPDEALLAACLTTRHEDPELYVREASAKLNVALPAGAAAKLRVLIEEEKENLWLMPNAEPDGILFELKQRGYRLGLVTNSWPFPLRHLLETTGLVHLFEHIVSSHEVEVCKQDGPAIYHRAAERFGVRPDECLMFGDNLELDVLCPRIAGMQSVLFDPEEKHVVDGEFKDPVFRGRGIPFIRDLRELGPMLD